MGPWLASVRAVGERLGWVGPDRAPLGAVLGRTIYVETKRAASIVNVRRPARPLTPRTVRMLEGLFPLLEVGAIRIKAGCRLPANRFHLDGRFVAMTFGATIMWRGDLDETDPRHVVTLIHETCHVDQVRRAGGERAFAARYGEGYLLGGGSLPSYLADPSAYHRNPLEAEAYALEARFRDASGRVVADRIPWR